MWSLRFSTECIPKIWKFSGVFRDFFSKIRVWISRRASKIWFSTTITRPRAKNKSSSCCSEKYHNEPEKEFLFKEHCQYFRRYKRKTFKNVPFSHGSALSSHYINGSVVRPVLSSNDENIYFWSCKTPLFVLLLKLKMLIEFQQIDC